jgi:recombination protein RecA
VMEKKPVRRKTSGTVMTLEKEVLAGIRAEIGDDGAQLLGSDELKTKVRGVISTCCMTLDAAIGRGGVPLSRLTILHGGEGSGKTTVALHLVAAAQHRGGVAVYIDKEYKLDPDYAAAIGVDTNRLIISQPRELEQVLRAIKKAISIAAAARKRTGKRVPILVILDSINAATAKVRLEGDEGDSHIAPEARLWSGHLPAIVEECSKEDVALVLVSQVRSKIGVLFGSNEDMAGGNAPRFYASLIIYIKRVGTHKRDGEKKANIIEAECRKNQIGPPFKKAKFLLEYGKGIDWEHSLIMQAEMTGDVQAKGSFLYFDDKKIGQGRDAASDNLRKNKDLATEIEKAVRISLGWDE